MWTMVMLVLLCLLLVLVLGMLVVFFLAESHASKHKDLIHRKLQSQSDAVDIVQGASSCHFCGGMRFRQSCKTGGSTPSVYTNDEKMHLREHFLATKQQLVVFMKNTFQKSIGRQKVTYGKGVILRGLRGLGSVFSSKSPRQARVADSLSLGSVVTVPMSQAQPTKSPSDRGCAAGVSGQFSTSSSSVSGSLMAAGLSGVIEAESLHDKRSAELNPKLAPLRRLVLKILMSPSVSNGGEMQDSSPVSSGLRLELETNAMLEHLTSVSNAPCPGSNSQMGETGTKEASVARLVCLPIETVSTTLGDNELLSMRSAMCGSCHLSDTGMNSLDVSTTLGNNKLLSVRPAMCGSCRSSDTGINSLDIWSVDSSAAAGVGLDDVRGNRECAYGRQTLLSNCSGHYCDKVCNACGSGCVVSPSMGSSSMAKFKQPAGDGKLKLSISSPPVINCSDTNIEVCLKDAVKDDCLLHAEKAPVFSMDSLGSLHITLLKAGTKSNMPEEDRSNLHAPSALAALNVKSVACKSGGNMGSFVSEDIPKRSTKNLQSSTQNSTTVVSETLQDNGLDSSIEAAEEPLVAANCRSFNDGPGSKKKEKKKRRNKAKKQKEKEGVSCSQERQEICKIAVETVRPVSGTREKEIGCICGSVKGGFHSMNCPYPFTSSGSMLQRRIKEQYDELVKSNSAKTLTLAQVGKFTTCLVEAKASLQQKSELIQRRFTIAKSLLSKADKSSFDRLCGQIYGLEMEQKKLEEDTIVYNRLQEQLKLSPAYKKMLEYGRAHFELQPHTGQMIEKLEPEDTEISFEELLAQEKKDSFWQKHSLPRSSIPVGG